MKKLAVGINLLLTPLPIPQPIMIEDATIPAPGSWDKEKVEIRDCSPNYMKSEKPLHN